MPQPPIPVPLMGGFYVAQNLSVNAQRCVNLYPEKQPEDSQPPVPVATYPTPGLTRRGRPPVPAACRCAYFSSDEQLFVVVGQSVYFVDQGFAYTLLGAISSGNNPCYMQDNGTDIILVDGTANGYTINLATNAFAAIVDPDFYGGDRIDFIDGYFILNKPGTTIAYISKQFSTVFDPLDFFAKAGYPDKLVSLIALKRELWLLGRISAEVFVNAGAVDSIFQQLPGSFQEHGCASVYSLAKADVDVYWLGQDKDGNRIVFKAGASSGYAAKRISTHAIENVIKGYATVTDAIGFLYQQLGHLFYVLTFPSANATWVFDENSGMWHQRAWLDSNGNLDRWRANAYCTAYGYNLIGDWENGDLLQIDPDSLTDDGNPIPRIRAFPHILQGLYRVIYPSLTVHISCGEDPAATEDDPPQLSLRFSDDGGRTWSNAINMSMGAAGQYNETPKFTQLGMARDRVFELSWANATGRALLGAYLEPPIMCGS